MKILVTGSEGNVGQYLVPHLIKQGHEVFRLDIRHGYGERYLTADVNSPGDLRQAFESFRPEVVFHLAAVVSRVVSERSPGLCLSTNVTGTHNIIQLCKEFASKLIFFSTSEVYGNLEGDQSEDRTDLVPNNIYGISKMLAEKLVAYEKEYYGLKAVIVRPFMLYHENETRGEYRSAMIRFAENVYRGRTIPVHKGSSRSWLHLDDAVCIFEKLIYSEVPCVNVGHPDVICTLDLARLMCDYVGVSYRMIQEIEIPDKMTLDKNPVLVKQAEETQYECQVDIHSGVRRVLRTMSERIKAEGGSVSASMAYHLNKDEA